MNLPTKRRLSWLAFALALLTGFYSWAGIVMASSFAVADPARASGHRMAVYVYSGVIIVALIVAVAAVLMLWRARREIRVDAT